MEVLLPVDGSDASLQAVRFVASCGARDRVHPVLLNVQRPPVQAWPHGFDVGALTQALHEQGDAQLDAVTGLLTDSAMQPERLVRVGHPADTILEVAQARKVGAIVMGTRGKGVLGGFALGSVALRVATAAECPVMLLKPETRRPAVTPLRIVAPVDGSEASAQAIRQLATLAPQFGEAHVDLVHYQQPLTFIETILPPHDDVVRNWTADAIAAAMEDMTRTLARAGLAYEVHCYTGDAEEGIARFAEEVDADLIAMAMHGSGTLRRLAFGSVTWKTVQLSRVPVVLMR